MIMQPRVFRLLFNRDITTKVSQNMVLTAPTLKINNHATAG